MAKKCPKCESDNPGTATFCADCGTQLPPSEDIDVTATIEAPKEELTRGTTFAGRYEIIEELGKGGMGRVYRVEDTKAKEEIALKLIKPEIALDKKTIERFRKELTTSRKITHKNVCRMYDLGEEKGLHFITMEYISGQDLKGLIRQTGQLTVGKAISIAKQICDGLTEAHDLGVVHRDLKPNNIMIDRGGNAKIMDFGIARVVKGKSITGSGVMIGTPQYMSPEQVEGKDVDHRSDIYSLGIILYEMLTDRVPFDGDTPLTVGVKQKTEIPKDPKDFNEQIPDDLNTLILKCLEKERENRYQSANEVGSDLEKFEQRLPTSDRVVPKKKTLTSREITVKFNLKKIAKPGIAVVSLIVVAILLWKFLPQKTVPSAPIIENSIALISFTNQTGDPAYDYLQDVIPNLLITNLENTGLFHVATWERMKDIIKQMGIKQTQVIDSELGFDLCRREGYKAIAIGTFSKAGDVFTTDVKIYDVESKRTLKSANTKGTGAGSILDNQINKLSREIALGLGAGMEKVEAAPLNIKDVTTHSLEAYQYFLKGKEACNSAYMEDARTNLIKAIEIDPSFALAYVYLTWAHFDLGDMRAAEETIVKAMEFSDKTSQKDKLYLEFLHAWFIENDQEKPVAIINELTRKYPDEKWAYHLLGDFLRNTRRDLSGAYAQFEKWLELDPQNATAINHLTWVSYMMGDLEKAEEFIKMNEVVAPSDPGNLVAQAEMYFRMGQLDKAIAKNKQALEIRPNYWVPLEFLAYIYFLMEDHEESMKWANEFVSRVGPPGRKAYSLITRGGFHYWRGSYNEALDDFTMAEKMAEEVKLWQMNARALVNKGYVYLAKREFELSRKSIENAHEIFLRVTSPIYIPNYRASMAWRMGVLALKQGDIKSVDTRISEIESLLPEIKSAKEHEVFFGFLRDLLEGEMLLAQGALDAALAAGQRACGPKSPHWKDLPPYLDDYAAYHIDLIARSYEIKGNVAQAIQEYERLFKLSISGIPNFFIHPLYHYRLGLLYEKGGDVTKSRDELEKFLDLWKDADPGIAEVEDARKRLAELQVP